MALRELIEEDEARARRGPVNADSDEPGDPARARMLEELAKVQAQEARRAA